MPLVTFTQFVRPNGLRQQLVIDRPAEIADKAAGIIAAGCELHIEVLQTGYVSATIFDPLADDGDGDDVGCEIAPNGDPSIDNQTIAGDGAMMAIDNLIRNFNLERPHGLDGDDDEEFKSE